MLEHHLEKLIAFRAVARSGTFRGAADLLFITQPTLTRAIQTLEKSLNVKLFRRSVRGVTLTQEGDLLLAYAEKILHEAQDIEKKIENFSDELSGVISVGTYESLSVYLWPKFLTHFQKVAPHLKIRLNTKSSLNHVYELSQRRIQAVVDAEARPTTDMVCTTLYYDHFNFYAARKIKNNLLATQLSPETPFIYVPNACDQKGLTISQLLHKNSVQHEVRYEVDSFETAKALALEGLGVAVLPSRVAAPLKHHLYPIRVAGFPKDGFGKHRIQILFNSEDRKEPRIMAIAKEMRSFSQI